MDVRDARGEYRIEPAHAASGDKVPRDFKATEVGVIPEEWTTKRLGELGSVVRGASPRPAGDARYFDGSFIPWLTVAALTNIPENELTVKETAGFLTQEGARHSRTLAAGTVVIANSGATLGVAKLLGIKSCANDGIAAIIDQRLGDKPFLCHYFNTQTKRLREVVASGNGQPNLNTSLIKEIEIPFPTLSEQRAIAEALSDADALLGALDRLIAKKCDLKQAAMQQLLTGQTRLPGFTAYWEVMRLGDHATFLKHGVNSRAELTPDGEVKYLHYGDIHGADGLLLDPSATRMPYLSKSKAGGLDRLSNGDLVFADASEDVDGVGKSVELCGVGQTEVVSGMHTITVRFDKQVLADGFKAYLQFVPAFRQQLRRLAAGTKVYATNKAHIANAEVRLPGVGEQKAIVGVLSDMDAEIEALEARRTKTRDLKQAMMQELLTGRTRLVKPGAGKTPD